MVYIKLEREGAKGYLTIEYLHDLEGGVLK